VNKSDQVKLAMTQIKLTMIKIELDQFRVNAAVGANVVEF